MQEVMPIMHTQLGPPATVLAKSAQVRTGELLVTALGLGLPLLGTCGRAWAALQAIVCVRRI